MSRFRQLVDKEVSDKDWLGGIVIDNVPPIMLANDFINDISVLANAVLYGEVVLNEHALSRFNISANR